jgi:AbrB family looped-hinge helix DNA binding protein
MAKMVDMERMFMGAATVGERGQVVIPAEAREALGIHPGEKLLVFIAPGGHGVSFVRLAMLEEATEMLKRFAREITEEVEEE